jgi:hypothetical protein
MISDNCFTTSTTQYFTKPIQSHYKNESFSNLQFSVVWRLQTTKSYHTIWTLEKLHQEMMTNLKLIVSTMIF